MRVLLATDGSRHAREATEWLTGFPLGPATNVLVVAVAVVARPTLEVPTSRELHERVLVAARVAADDAAVALRHRWPETAVRVVEGDPRDIIPATATHWNADLVVVGARGLGAVGRVLLGSVSTAVVHHAPCPVLVVKGRPRGLARAVVAVDGSADSLAAARLFSGLPRPRALTVQLVAVVEPPYVPRTAPGRVTRVVRAAADQMIAEQRARLEKVLADVEREFGADAISERSVPVGRPADEVLLAARNADLIVIGARGLGPIERLLLGSVSDRVLHHARCSVLVVRRPQR